MRKSKLVLPIALWCSMAAAAVETQLPATGVTTVTADYWKVTKQTFRLGWPRVTTRTDGAALPASQIAKYTLYRAPNALTSSDRVDTRTMGASATYATTTQPVCTTYRYGITVTDTKGLESPASDPVIVTTYCPAQ